MSGNERVQMNQWLGLGKTPDFFFSAYGLSLLGTTSARAYACMHAVTIFALNSASMT